MNLQASLANAIRVLAMDAVQAANSGHPGAPMGMAEIAVALWNRHLKHNPVDPKWADRDRFVLSNGHGSMLLYALLHLTGYDLPLSELKRFRQLGSKTPGHPEVGHTAGVETTTGPLGQGISNSVGFALAEKLLAQEFNRDGFKIVDHYSYAFLGDGCMMEGISHEACSLAGVWKLSKLIAFYDDNGISIDGHVEGWFADDTPKRFEAYGWNVIRGVDGHDIDAVDAAIKQAKAQNEKPTLICCKTVIGKGSPNKAGTHDVHGAPLGKDEIAATRAALGITDGPFEIPAEVCAAWNATAVGAKAQAEWQQRFAAYAAAYPELAAEFTRRMAGQLSADYAAKSAEALKAIIDKGETIATRKSSQNAIQALAPVMPEFIGGSADLAPSNLTQWKGATDVVPGVTKPGNYIHYGVREFGMAAIMNGLVLHGGFRPFGGTFLMFSEYARNAVRMAALMKINPIYVFTHDSIGVGEDGPTHQPVEQTRDAAHGPQPRCLASVRLGRSLRRVAGRGRAPGDADGADPDPAKPAAPGARRGPGRSDPPWRLRSLRLRRNAAGGDHRDRFGSRARRRRAEEPRREGRRRARRLDAVELRLRCAGRGLQGLGAAARHPARRRRSRRHFLLAAVRRPRGRRRRHRSLRRMRSGGAGLRIPWRDRGEGRRSGRGRARTLSAGLVCTGKEARPCAGLFFVRRTVGSTAAPRQPGRGGEPTTVYCQVFVPCESTRSLTKGKMMSAVRERAVPAAAHSRLLMSGNDAVARAVWESGVRVAAAYPGTPATEMLEVISTYPDLYAEWSVNEKVSLEVAFGASMAGSRAFCAMKHVGMNVASDALMTMTLTGAKGGLVIAVADDVGLSSSQNEQDSRYWGRFAHVPVFEPADSQEAYDFTRAAFDFSERFETPVILRLTTRVCHVKAIVTVGERQPKAAAGFTKDVARWVMVPGAAGRRLPLMFERESALRAEAEVSKFNIVEKGADRRVGFVTSGPAYMHVRESFPDAPVLKLGLSCPLPFELVRAFAKECDTLVVVEEVEPLIETEIKAQGIAAHGKDILPRSGELAPHVLKPAIARLLGEPVGELPVAAPMPVFPRPPTMCAACPHLGVYYTLAQVRNVAISGDIGCYTLGFGEPWNALDACISMGASMGMALGLDKGRGDGEEDKKVIAVIGDSTFMHMGMQGLLDIVYNRGNVTVLLLDNRAVGMTGGQNNPGNGRGIHGEEAPRVDFATLVKALGVKEERVHVVDPYELPTLFKLLRQETKVAEPSVIITNQPCVLGDDYQPRKAYKVVEPHCTGCGNCVDVGCPAIHVTRRDTIVKLSGREVKRAFVRIDSAACTGCGLCLTPCAPNAIVPVDAQSKPIQFAGVANV